MDLNTIWFLLIVILFAGYAVLDGFDFGVGVLHLFTPKNEERRINLNAIGPIWDGNEVWLLTGGGALFAAFPIVYATVFSGFYLALILLLIALIFRAISLEFRSKVDSPKWKNFCDWSFGLGSSLPAILFGVAFGNILHGIPIDQTGKFTGSFFGLLNPYSILIGVLSLVLFTMHGSIFMALKSEGAQRERNKKWSLYGWVVFIILYLLATILTIHFSPFLFSGLIRNPFLWILLFCLLTTIFYTPLALIPGKYFRALLSSSITIASMIGLAGLSLFPKLVPSGLDLTYSLTIYNSSSTPRTLSTMLLIALIGMPIVIIYTIIIYRVFKGKVVLEDESY